MDLSLLNKIRNEKKYYDFLRNHSYWYKYLNRNPDNFKIFLSEYKKYSRDRTTNKVTDTINNLDMVTNILKILE